MAYHLRRRRSVRDLDLSGHGVAKAVLYHPGIYCVFEGKELIYSGETGSLAVGCGTSWIPGTIPSANNTTARSVGKHPYYQAATLNYKFCRLLERYY